MKKIKFSLTELQLEFKKTSLQTAYKWLEQYAVLLLLITLCAVSVTSFVMYYQNGLGLSYNDARSHLDIGRRVVEGLKPGFAQLGSVWLPLPHILMIPTIWQDWMWHSGLSGALQSMVSFVITGILIYYYLQKLGVKLLGRVVGVLVFLANFNILYLQSTAMTELLLLATMTAGAYELMIWHKTDAMYRLIKAAFFICLSTLIRYDGWFLFAFSAGLVALHTLKRRGYKTAEGMTVLFCTMGGFGIFLWFLWNLLIFNDPLYFAFGPFSAHAQQEVLEQAGVLATKGRFWYSLKVYFYAMAYNMGLFTVILGAIGAVILWFDKQIPLSIRIASSALLAPFFFNVIALFLGHSVLYVQGLSGNSWFNVRYGIMMMPSVAIFIGYLVHRIKLIRFTLIGLLLFVTTFAVLAQDAVTIDDARVGASGKNVSEVSDYLKDHATKNNNYILVSAASHDAVIFSSDLPMSRYIHEGTGKYWDAATVRPDLWARYIILRTGDGNDLTARTIGHLAVFKTRYTRVKAYPFADIYELKPEFLHQLRTDRPFSSQR